MKIYERIEDFIDPKKTPLILTIGNFDGVHRGHVAVLNKVKELAADQGQLVILTFRNHPSELLQPDHPTPLLCTLEHKLLLLEKEKCAHIILLNFTRYLANHSAATFIENLRETIPFTHLVLGHDATLGRDRQGSRPVLAQLGDQWGFTLHYIDEYRYEGKIISSSIIRKAIQAGKLQEAETLLNRPYSIYAPLLKDFSPEQYPNRALKLNVAHLCLPPPGIYQILAHLNGIDIPGSAHITQEKQSQLIFELFLDANLTIAQDAFLEVEFNS